MWRSAVVTVLITILIKGLGVLIRPADAAVVRAIGAGRGGWSVQPMATHPRLSKQGSQAFIQPTLTIEDRKHHRH